MRPRVIIGRFLIRCGRFIQSLAILVMRSKDLVEFSQQTYEKKRNVEYYCQNSVVDPGLTASELALMEKLPQKTGKLLVLGMGGGREAIFFAKKGYEVTGIDFIGKMVETTVENARQKGLTITGLVQEISALEIPAERFDIIWLSPALYSYLPTRKKRVQTLKKIAEALKHQGYLLCQFHWNREANKTGVTRLIRKIIAIVWGNFRHQTGDILWRNSEFVHEFYSENVLRTEFEDGGFKVIHLNIPDVKYIGEALLIKE